MNVENVLAILKEINQALTTLQAMGVKINGEINVTDVIGAVTHLGKPSA